MKLHELAQSSLEDVCKTLLPAAPESAPADEEPALCRAAVIGFAGDKVRGTLGVATSQAGLNRVLANAGLGDDAAGCERSRAEDSLAELSNLLLGAIKRAWLRRGVHITLSTPLVIRGLAIEVCGGENNNWFATEASNGGDRITAWMDVNCDKNHEVPDEDTQDDEIAEGEALLF